MERYHAFRVKQDLEAANAELAMRAHERDVALFVEHMWRDLYEDIKKNKCEITRRLCDVQEHLKEERE